MIRVAVAVLLASSLLAACSEQPAQRAVPEPDDAVVVASFDFSESELLGELYAQALEGAGVPVRRELRLGPRELVLPALQQGLVDIVPEYLGTALAAVAPEATPGLSGSTAQTHQRLTEELRDDGLQALAPAAAQNQNGLAVTRATAESLDLTTTSDLRDVAPRLSLTGPAECPNRPYCLQGLTSVYGLSFRRFEPYESESQRITALEQGLVDVAVVFTTDGWLADENLVLLEDDRNLQPVENIVPVVTTRAVTEHGSTMVRALDAVSKQLDSPALTFLNWRVEVGGGDVPAEARAWLQRHDLLPR